MLPSMTFVLGGAASGKSLFAEKLLLASNLTPVYLATTRVWGSAEDSEMKSRIATHRARRDAVWRSYEAAQGLGDVLRGLEPGSAALIDCATMWLTNYMMDGADLTAASDAFLEELAPARIPLVIVSNEIGQGIVPMEAETRAFREAQGRLNIAIAAQADTVVQVVAGLPNVLKGRLA